MRMNKRNQYAILILIITMIMMFTLVGCGSSDAATSTDTGTSDTSSYNEPSASSYDAGADIDAAYVEAASANTISLSYAFGDLSETLGYYNPQSQAWIDDCAERLFAMQSLCDEAYLIPVPSAPELKQAHSIYMQAIGEYETMINLIINGIDKNDSYSIDQAGECVTRGNTLIKQATDIIDSYNN